MHALQLSLSIYVLSWQHFMAGNFERARIGAVLSMRILLRCVADFRRHFLGERPDERQNSRL